MAAPSGFSIREYALNKRSEGLFRSWPFGDNVKKESSVEDSVSVSVSDLDSDLLPPITVTKFRWWSHELEVLKSNCLNENSEKAAGSAENNLHHDVQEMKLEKICPVCRVFATATVNAMSAHIDSCLASEITKDKEKRMFMKKVANVTTKPKSRTPKKRSIAEIFAVAPPIQTIAVDKSGFEDDDDGKRVMRDEVKIKASSSSLARSLVSVMKTIKAKKKKKKKELDKTGASKLKNAIKKASIARKEIGNELPCKRGKRNHRDVSILCKKPSFKCLSRQKKNKLVKKCKLIAKQQRPVPPIRSILKHSTKVVSETNPLPSKLDGGDQVISYGGQRSDRRVSFLGKDDVLGPRTISSSDLCEPSVSDPFRDSFSASKENNMSEESNKEVASMDVGANDDDIVSFRTVQKFDSQHIRGKIQLPGIHDQVSMQSSLRPHPCWDSTKYLAEKLVPANRVIPQESNLHWLDHGYPTAPHEPTHSRILGLQAVQEEEKYAHVKAPLVSNIPQAQTFFGKSSDHVINPIHGVAALSSMTSTLPVFPSENSVCRFQNFSESSAKDTSKLNFHHEPCLTQMEMMNTRCSFPNWEQSAVACKAKGVNEDFFCLPLNSKGELIQLNSGPINRYDQMNEARNNMACPSSSVPVCRLVLPRGSQDYFMENENLLVDRELIGDQLTLFPLHSNMQENQNRYLPARFDTAPGTSRTADRGTESGSLLHSNLMDVSFNRCRHYGMLQNQKVSTGTYPENSNCMFVNPPRQTMRLMGKDVAVGASENNIEEFEGINFWKSKGALIDNCPTSSVQENPMRKRDFLQDWVSPHPSKGETLLYPSGFHSNQVVQSSLFTNAPQSRFPHPCLNNKGNLVHQRPDSAINLNERFNNIHAFSPSSTEDFNMAPNFEAPFISGAETLRFGSQPSAFSLSHHMNQNRFGNALELGCNQNERPAKLGTFNFPFLHPDDENYVQLSWFHGSKSLPSWMLHANQREEGPTAASKLTDINGYYYPLSSSGTNVLTVPSLHRLPEASYPCSTMPSHFQMKKYSSSMFPPNPVVPRVQVPSIVNAGYGSRMNTEDRLKLNTLSVKDFDLSNRIKKRPVVELVDSRKRQKFPIMEKNNFGERTGWPRGRFDGDLQSNFGAAKIHVIRDKAAGNIPKMAQNDGTMTSPTTGSPKVEFMARPGPIKLTAGAKHILKPSQSMDLDNIKPTYSTIPSDGLNHSVSLTGSDKKTTKVYSF